MADLVADVPRFRITICMNELHSIVEAGQWFICWKLKAFELRPRQCGIKHDDAVLLRYVEMDL